MTRLITPEEALSGKHIPDFVFEAFNKWIAKTFNGRYAVVSQEDVVMEILKNKDVKRDKIFSEGWLNIEKAYKVAGWRVEYDKPGWDETGCASFKFTPFPK